MSDRPNEAMLIDYLYGELSAAESARVEQYLREHPEEKAKLAGLADTRTLLTTYADKEVIVPTDLEKDRKRVGSLQVPLVRWTLGVAASIGLLLLLAYIVDLKIELSSNELSMQFGEQQEQPPGTVTMEQLQATISGALEANYEKQEQLMHTFRHEWESKQAEDEKRYKDGLQKWAENYLRDQKAGLGKYVEGLEQNQQQVIDTYFAHAAIQQQAYMKDLLMDFASYMDEQRKQDKEFYLNRLIDLKISSDIRQQETEQVLTSIINTVNNLPSETTTQNF